MARLRLPPRLQPATSLQGDSWLPVSWNLQERLWFTFVQATDARQDTAKAIRCKRILPLSGRGLKSPHARQVSRPEPVPPLRTEVLRRFQKFSWPFHKEIS